jgi:hypothetical protein
VRGSSPTVVPGAEGGLGGTGGVDAAADTEVCGDCGRRFGQGRLAKHAKVCRWVFGHKRSVFNAHERRIRDTMAERFQDIPPCQLCGQTFSDTEHARLHGLVCGGANAKARRRTNSATPSSSARRRRGAAAVGGTPGPASTVYTPPAANVRGGGGGNSGGGNSGGGSGGNSVTPAPASITHAQSQRRGSGVAAAASASDRDVSSTPAVAPQALTLIKQKLRSRRQDATLVTDAGSTPSGGGDRVRGRLQSNVNGSAADGHGAGADVTPASRQQARYPSSQSEEEGRVEEQHGDDGHGQPHGQGRNHHYVAAQQHQQQHQRDDWRSASPLQAATESRIPRLRPRSLSRSPSAAIGMAALDGNQPPSVTPGVSVAGPRRDDRPSHIPSLIPVPNSSTTLHRTRSPFAARGASGRDDDDDVRGVRVESAGPAAVNPRGVVATTPTTVTATATTSPRESDSRDPAARRDAGDVDQKHGEAAQATVSGSVSARPPSVSTLHVSCPFCESELAKDALPSHLRTCAALVVRTASLHCRSQPAGVTLPLAAWCRL